MRNTVAFLFLLCAATTSRAGSTFNVPEVLKPFEPYEGRIVSDVSIAGNSVTRDIVLYREIHTEAGQPLRLKTVRDDIIRLENVGIFSSIVVDMSEDSTGVAVTYNVKEMPWIVPFLKFSYTEQNGWSVGPSVASLNLGGRAIYLSGYWIFGGVNAYSFKLSYPWIAPNYTKLDLIVADLTRDDSLNEFEEESFEVTPWIRTNVGETIRVGATASVFEMRADRDSVTLSNDRRDQFFRVGASIEFDSRDAWRNPRRGWKNELFVQWSSGSMFGRPGDWVLAQLDIRRYQPLVGKHGLNLGGLISTQSGTVGTDVPSYFQYRLGGANSIRGYDVDQGKELFGKNQLLLTTEYQYEVLPLSELSLWRWSVSVGLEAAAFFDYGAAWAEKGQFDKDNSKIGYGIGLRWLVPGVNVVRTDLGISQTGDVVFHLGILEKFEAQKQRLR